MWKSTYAEKTYVEKDIFRNNFTYRNKRVYVSRDLGT